MEEEKKEHEDRSKALEGEVDSVRDFPEETLCPSCGKFVGAYEKCPYCGAVLKKRMALAIFKRGCLVMSVLGLAALWYSAVVMEPKLITAGEIGPTYNKGIFRVQGMVTSRTIDPEGFFKLKMILEDETGRISVKTGDLEGLERLGKIPNVGDEVEAIGEVSISAQFGTSLTLKAPERMKIERREIQTARIGELEPGNIYAIYGEVLRVREGKNRVTVVLGDETGIVEISLYTSALKELPDAEAVMKPGSELELAGTTSVFRGKMGIKPTSPAEVKVSGEDKIKTDTIATKRIGYAEEKIGSLTPSDKGKKVKVSGKISGKKQIPKGTKFNLSDETGSIEITLWDDDFADYPNKAAVIKDGNEIIMYGRVDEWQGKIQLSPQDHLDLQPVKKPAPKKKKEEAKPAPPKEKKKPTPKPAPPKVEKKPEAPKPAAPPVEKKPEAPKPAAPAAEKKPEAPKPAAPAAEKKPEAPKPAPPAAEKKPEAPPKKEEPKAEAPKKPSITFAPMKIGDITTDKVGQFAEITGEVVGSNEFSKGLKIEVKDATGTIDVVLWTNLVEKLTNKDELAKEGAKLSVKGKIGSYRDEMQLTPKYPNQIKLAE